MFKNQNIKNVFFTLIDAKKNTILIGKKLSHYNNPENTWGFFAEPFVSAEDISDSMYRGIKKYLGIERISGGEWSDRHYFYGQKNQKELAHFLLCYFDEARHHLEYDHALVSDVRWLTLEELKNSQNQYDLQTNYWINHAFWDKAFAFSRNGW